MAQRSNSALATGHPPWATVVQWNCRTLRRKKADLVAQFHCDGTTQGPSILALQEVNGPVLKLPGYEGYPSYSDPGQTTSVALYVLRMLDHVQLDTEPWNTSTTTTVGCRVKLTTDHTVLIFSLYARLEYNCNKGQKPLKIGRAHV